DEPARRAAHARRHGPLRLGPDRRAREVEALQERDLHLANDAQRRQGSLLADRGGRAVNLRQLWAAAGRWYAAHSARDRRVLAGIGALAALSLLYVAAVKPLIHYRQRVKTEIEEGQDQLEHAARFLAAADALRAERDELRQRLAQAKERLLPGSSGTLGAAALQERANSLAAEKGITVQSTQVMKEEPVEPFRKIALRLTLSGELKPFAELLSGLEYGPQQLTIPFVELSRPPCPPRPPPWYPSPPRHPRRPPPRPRPQPRRRHPQRPRRRGATDATLGDRQHAARDHRRPGGLRDRAHVGARPPEGSAPG